MEAKFNKYGIRCYLKIYLVIITCQIKKIIKYRSDFLIGTICLLLSFLSMQLFIAVIFSQIHELHGWKKEQIIFTYGFNLIVTGIVWLFFSKLWTLRDSLISGDFIRYKLRPINPMFYCLFEEFDIKSLNTILLGVFTIIYASNEIDYALWNVYNLAKIFFFAGVSSLLLISVLLFFTSFGFIFNCSTSILSILTHLSGSSYYPITIYGNIIIILLTSFIPIGLVTYYPMFIFFQDEFSFSFIIKYLLTTVIFISLAIKAWSLGIKNYQGSGH